MVKRVRALSTSKETGGGRLSSSITDGVILPTLVGCPPSTPLDVRKRLPGMLLKFGKPTDSTTGSDVSFGISSHGSDFTSPTESLADPTSYYAPQQSRSETPAFGDNSQPPALNFSGRFADKAKKRGKQVSFADFAIVLKEGAIFISTPGEPLSPGGGSDELQLSASPRASSSFTPPTPQQLSSSLRSVQSMGEIPSTPSIANIYYQSQQETQSNFYTQPTKREPLYRLRQLDMMYIESPHGSKASLIVPANRRPVGTLPPSPILDDLDVMYIESPHGSKASLIVPANRRSVGSLPPSPILDNLFLSEEEACKISFDAYKATLGNDEQANGRTVLWADVSDTESEDMNILTTTDDSFDEFCPYDKVEESTFTETSSCLDGADFGISRAWFTAAEEASSPDSFEEFSYGGGVLM